MVQSAAPATLLLSSFFCLAFAQGLGDDPCDGPNPCVSYGVDFQDQGSYFQNISSTERFTFVQFFEGCQTDFTNNVLIDDAGDEYMCSNTNITPDDTNQLSTCDIDKDQLTSGDWSLVIISNNGDACPIAYERDFYLSVGEPSTAFFTPTVTLSATTTPLYNLTSTTTSTSVLTSTSVVTSPLRTSSPTTTITPSRITTTKIITFGTLSRTKYTASPTLVTKTKLQTCSVPPRQPWHDPWARITPTLVHAAALETTAAAASATGGQRRRDVGRRVAVERKVRVAERKARLVAGGAKERRDLDAATTTITATDTSLYPTTTLLSTAPTSTVTVITIQTISSTTWTTSTSLTGTTTLPQVTITAPTPTKTHTQYTLLTTTVATVTWRPTITITVHTAPAQSTVICRAKGGKMVG